jgi:hypothetical protein
VNVHLAAVVLEHHDVAVAEDPAILIDPPSCVIHKVQARFAF